jgi:hypothetical protein
MIGGKLTGETRTNPENLSGSGIEGGSSRAVAKGLFLKACPTGSAASTGRLS